MGAVRQRRLQLRQVDLETAYAFAKKHELPISALRVSADGGFSLDFGPPQAANDDAVDQELAELEEKHRGRRRP